MATKSINIGIKVGTDLSNFVKEIDAVKQSLIGLDSGVTSFTNLTKATKEWEEALKIVNSSLDAITGKLAQIKLPSGAAASRAAAGATGSRSNSFTGGPGSPSGLSFVGMNKQQLAQYAEIPLLLRNATPATLALAKKRFDPWQNSVRTTDEEFGRMGASKRELSNPNWTRQQMAKSGKSFEEEENNRIEALADNARQTQMFRARNSLASALSRQIEAKGAGMEASGETLRRNEAVRQARRIRATDADLVGTAKQEDLEKRLVAKPFEDQVEAEKARDRDRSINQGIIRRDAQAQQRQISATDAERVADRQQAEVLPKQFIHEETKRVADNAATRQMEDNEIALQRNEWKSRFTNSMVDGRELSDDIKMARRNGTLTPDHLERGAAALDDYHATREKLKQVRDGKEVEGFEGVDAETATKAIGTINGQIRNMTGALHEAKSGFMDTIKTALGFGSAVVGMQQVIGALKEMYRAAVQVDEVFTKVRAAASLVSDPNRRAQIIQGTLHGSLAASTGLGMDLGEASQAQLAVRMNGKGGPGTEALAKTITNLVYTGIGNVDTFRNALVPMRNAGLDDGTIAHHLETVNTLSANAGMSDDRRRSFLQSLSSNMGGLGTIGDMNTIMAMSYQEAEVSKDPSRNSRLNRLEVGLQNPKNLERLKQILSRNGERYDIGGMSIDGILNNGNPQSTVNMLAELGQSGQLSHQEMRAVSQTIDARTSPGTFALLTKDMDTAKEAVSLASNKTAYGFNTSEDAAKIQSESLGESTKAVMNSFNTLMGVGIGPVAEGMKFLAALLSPAGQAIGTAGANARAASTNLLDFGKSVAVAATTMTALKLAVMGYEAAENSAAVGKVMSAVSNSGGSIFGAAGAALGAMNPVTLGLMVAGGVVGVGTFAYNKYEEKLAGYQHAADENASANVWKQNGSATKATDLSSYVAQLTKLHDEGKLTLDEQHQMQAKIATAVGDRDAAERIVLQTLKGQTKELQTQMDILGHKQVGTTQDNSAAMLFNSFTRDGTNVNDLVQDPKKLAWMNSNPSISQDFKNNINKRVSDYNKAVADQNWQGAGTIGGAVISDTDAFKSEVPNLTSRGMKISLHDTKLAAENFNISKTQFDLADSETRKRMATDLASGMSKKGVLSTSDLVDGYIAKVTASGENLDPMRDRIEFGSKAFTDKNLKNLPAAIQQYTNGVLSNSPSEVNDFGKLSADKVKALLGGENASAFIKTLPQKGQAQAYTLSALLGIQKEHSNDNPDKAAAIVGTGSEKATEVATLTTAKSGYAKALAQGDWTSAQHFMDMMGMNGDNSAVGRQKRLDAAWAADHSVNGKGGSGEYQRWLKSDPSLSKKSLEDQRILWEAKTDSSKLSFSDPAFAKLDGNAIRTYAKSKAEENFAPRYDAIVGGLDLKHMSPDEVNLAMLRADVEKHTSYNDTLMGIKNGVGVTGDAPMAAILAAHPNLDAELNTNNLSGMSAQRKLDAATLESTMYPQKIGMVSTELSLTPALKYGNSQEKGQAERALLQAQLDITKSQYDTMKDMQGIDDKKVENLTKQAELYEKINEAAESTKRTQAAAAEGDAFAHSIISEAVSGNALGRNKRMIGTMRDTINKGTEDREFNTLERTGKVFGDDVNNPLSFLGKTLFDPTGEKSKGASMAGLVESNRDLIKALDALRDSVSGKGSGSSSSSASTGAAGSIAPGKSAVLGMTHGADTPGKSVFPPGTKLGPNGEPTITKVIDGKEVQVDAKSGEVVPTHTDDGSSPAGASGSLPSLPGIPSGDIALPSVSGLTVPTLSGPPALGMNAGDGTSGGEEVAATSIAREDNLKDGQTQAAKDKEQSQRIAAGKSPLSQIGAGFMHGIDKNTFTGYGAGNFTSDGKGGYTTQVTAADGTVSNVPVGKGVDPTTGGMSNSGIGSSVSAGVGIGLAAYSGYAAQRGNGQAAQNWGGVGGGLMAGSAVVGETTGGTGYGAVVAAAMAVAGLAAEALSGAAAQKNQADKLNAEYATRMAEMDRTLSIAEEQRKSIGLAAESILSSRADVGSAFQGVGASSFLSGRYAQRAGTVNITNLTVAANNPTQLVAALAQGVQSEVSRGA